MWVGCVWRNCRGSSVGKLCGGIVWVEAVWESCVQELWGAKCMWSCVKGAVWGSWGSCVWELPLPLVPTHSSSQVAHCSVCPPHPLHAPLLVLHLAVYSTIVQHRVEWGHVSATCVVHSVLASLVHSLCTSAADPFYDLEGARRAATGECDVFVYLFVCLFTVSLTLHPMHTCSCVYMYILYMVVVCHFCLFL